MGNPIPPDEPPDWIYDWGDPPPNWPEDWPWPDDGWTDPDWPPPPDPPIECPQIPRYIFYYHRGFQYGYACVDPGCQTWCTDYVGGINYMEIEDCPTCFYAWYQLVACVCEYPWGDVYSAFSCLYVFVGCSNAAEEPPW